MAWDASWDDIGIDSDSDRVDPVGPGDGSNTGVNSWPVANVFESSDDENPSAPSNAPAPPVKRGRGRPKGTTGSAIWRKATILGISLQSLGFRLL